MGETHAGAHSSLGDVGLAVRDETPEELDEDGGDKRTVFRVEERDQMHCGLNPIFKI